jgi:drug/metabolite transporter (DMT)-like permease
MDLRRLRAGEWLAAAAGVVLVVSLALPWYEADDGDVSGYQALSVIDVLLVLVAASAFTLAILQATQTSPTLPVAFGVLTVVAGAIGTLLVLFRLIDVPGAGPVDVREGAWIGLIAVVALTAGGWLSIKNEHVSHVPPGPEPELRPAPSGS